MRTGSMPAVLVDPQNRIHVVNWSCTVVNRREIAVIHLFVVAGTPRAISGRLARNWDESQVEAD
jgi:hypothetical protein